MFVNFLVNELQSKIHAALIVTVWAGDTENQCLNMAWLSGTHFQITQWGEGGERLWA